jgi:peptidoglycan/xylan/chitin deacetylase (PgdA/CDA1 family)
VIPPILCYHKVDRRFELGFTQLEPFVFRRQVEALARLGYRSLGSTELLGCLASGTTPHSPSVVFTFDDAYDSLAGHAFPLLADHGFGALVFVITDYVGRDNRWDVRYGWRSFRHLGWEELGRWAERGMEAHSHTATHARLTWVSDAQLADELSRSREAVAGRLGSAPAAVSYPFGAADARVRAAAAAAGYRLGFAGPWADGGDPLLLPRRPVYAWDRFSPPLVMRPGSAGAAARWVATLTSRCSVGTAAVQRLLGRRYRRRA